MPYIVLNEEQAHVINASCEPVEVRDRWGNVLARIEPSLAADRIAELRRRAASSQPRYTSEQVQTHLEALEDAVERQGLDPQSADLAVERGNQSPFC